MLLKRSKLLLSALAFVVMAIAAFSSLNYLFEADIALLKVWYPRFYLPVYLAVKSFFPALVFVVVYFWLQGTSFKNHSVLVAGSGALLALVLVEATGICFLFVFSLAMVLSGVLFWARYTIREFTRFIITYNSPLLYQWLLGSLIFVVIVLRMYFAYSAENSSQIDASCRILIAHIWANYYWGNVSFDKILNPNVDWPPLHFYITGIIWKLTTNQKILICVHALAGIAGAWFLYKISRLFASTSVALLSLLCFLAYPAHIWVSMAVMTEPWFVATLLSTIYFFMRLTETNSNKYFIGYILSISATCLLRYEGWPLVILFPVVHVVFNRFKLQRKQLIFLAALIVPAGIMWLNFYQGFHPLRGILYSDEQVAWCYDRIGRTIFVLAAGYKKAWVPGALLLAILTIFQQKRNARVLLFAVIVALYSLPYLYKVATFSIMPDYRYLISYTVLLLPLFCLGLFRVFTQWIPQSIFSKAIFTLLLLLPVCFGFKFDGLYSYKFASGFNESVQTAKVIKEGDFILDYHGGVQAYSWIALSNIPIIPEKEHWYLKQFIDFNAVKKGAQQQGSHKRIAYMVNDYENAYHAIDFALIDRLLLDSKPPVYLVLFPRGPLSKYFKFQKQTETYRQFEFTQEFEKDGYYVYRLKR